MVKSDIQKYEYYNFTHGMEFNLDRRIHKTFVKQGGNKKPKTKAPIMRSPPLAIEVDKETTISDEPTPTLEITQEQRLKI